MKIVLDTRALTYMWKKKKKKPHNDCFLQTNFIFGQTKYSTQEFLLEMCAKILDFPELTVLQ